MDGIVINNTFAEKFYSCYRTGLETMIMEANELSSFDAQVGHTCVNHYGSVCIIEEKEEQSLTKKRKGKGKREKGNQRNV